MSVTLHTTTGDIKIELFCEECPKTCENFLALCASEFYKNNIFHRNIKDFMVQTGDPTGTGKGGNSIWGSPFEDELNPSLRHETRGVVSMANNGANTNKSQFFITYGKQIHLDLKYTVFGRIIDGFDALDELETIKVDAKYRPVVEQRLQPEMVIMKQCPNCGRKLQKPNRPMVMKHKRSNIRSFSSQSTPVPENSTTMKIRQMNDYFSQYIEEYYEEEDTVESKDETKQERSAAVEQVKPISSAEEIVALLEAERASNIVVLDLGDNGPGPVDTMVICSPFNPRHGLSVAELLRKAARLDHDAVTKRGARNNFGWYQVEIARTQVHVMTLELRERYDLEGLWAPALPESEEIETGKNEDSSPDDVDREVIHIIPPPRKQ